MLEPGDDSDPHTGRCCSRVRVVNCHKLRTPVPGPVISAWSGVLITLILSLRDGTNVMKNARYTPTEMIAQVTRSETGSWGGGGRATESIVYPNGLVAGAPTPAEVQEIVPKADMSTGAKGR